MTHQERIDQIKTFLEKQPKDNFLNYALATEYVAIGKEEEALAIFKELIHSQPDYYATYFHLAKLYERRGLDTLAEETYVSGLDVTKRLGENHAHRELKSALDELIM